MGDQLIIRDSGAEASYVQSPVACARKRLAACPLQVNQIQGANLGNGFHLVDLFHPRYGCVIFVLFLVMVTITTRAKHKMSSGLLSVRPSSAKKDHKRKAKQNTHRCLSCARAVTQSAEKITPKCRHTADFDQSSWS